MIDFDTNLGTTCSRMITLLTLLVSLSATVVVADPLLPAQHATLMLIYNATGCPTTQPSCVRFEANEECVSFESSLYCENGKVTRLSLYSSSLVGSIPTQVALLTDLQDLDFYDNKLIGTLPSQLGLLTKLTGLNVFDNLLTGTVPTHLGKLSLLAFLGLSGNDLEGTAPTELGQLTALEVLRLQRNRFTGALPTDLARLSQLQHIRLNRNLFSGVVPNLRSGLMTCDIQATDALETNCVDCASAPVGCECTTRQCTPTTSSGGSSGAISTTPKGTTISGSPSGTPTTSRVNGSSSTSVGASNPTTPMISMTSASNGTVVTQIGAGELRDPVDDGDSSTAIIAGVAGAVGGFMLGAVLVFLICRAQRRKRESSRRESSAQSLPSDAELERPAAAPAVAVSSSNTGNSGYMALPQPQPITPSSSSSASTSGYDKVPTHEQPSAVSHIASAYAKVPVTYSQIPADKNP